jgi:conjugal transfer pilus assembly protein TraV
MISNVIAIAALFTLASCGGNLECKKSIGGVTCESLSAAYQHRYDDQAGQSGKKDKGAHPAKDAVSGEIVRHLALDQDMPVRIPPKVIRIWIAPWEDQDGDLHQSGLIFSEITDKRGRWLFGEKAAASSNPIFYPLTSPAAPPEKGAPDKPPVKSGGQRLNFK